MTNLAIDFSSARRSVAVRRTDAHDKLVSEAEALEAGTKESKPFSLICSALWEAGMHRDQIENLIIGLGPGSYMGIRMALAMAQGWQFARKVRTAGVSSVLAIAFSAVESGIRENFSVVIDAQREEFYIENFAHEAGVPKSLGPLRLISAQEFKGLIGKSKLVGPEITRWDSAGTVIFPSASVLARIAGKAVQFRPAESLEPIYLRQPSFIKAPTPRRDI